MRPCTRTETAAVLSSDPPVRPGSAVVADEVVRPGGSALTVPAAALVAGALRRRGTPAHRGRVDAASAPAEQGGADAFLLALYGSGNGPPEDGRLIAAAAVAADDTAAAAAAHSVLGAIERAVRPRTVLLASPRSFCAGVERAIEIVERALAQHGSPVYVRKQIVHNVHVVENLRRRGAVFVDELDEVPVGATVVFSAHGVSPAVRTGAAERELDVIDATCPLVTKVHTEARRYADRGDTVVLIGHAGHEETEGTMGEAPESTVLVENISDVSALRVPDPARVSYMTQTTLAVDETAEIVEALRRRFPALRGPSSDDICYATTNRQDALRAVADESDLVLVIGSGNSSNSVRLVELSERRGTPARLIDDVSGIDPDWLAPAGTVGLTAGASAPSALVDEVVAALGGLGPVTLAEHQVTEETVRFAVPRRVQDR